MQLIHVTNGRFDFMDIGFFVLFWFLGRYITIESSERRNMLSKLNSKTIVCLISYCIVYLAHVFR